MYKEVNLKVIRTATVSADGQMTVNTPVESAAIIKSFETAKRLACEALKLTKAQSAATVVIALETRKQYYHIDDAIFFEYAVECEPPRAKRSKDDDGEEYEEEEE